MGQTSSADLIARYAISKEWQDHAYHILISLTFKSFALADCAFVFVKLHCCYAFAISATHLAICLFCICKCKRCLNLLGSFKLRICIASHVDLTTLVHHSLPTISKPKIPSLYCHHALFTFLQMILEVHMSAPCMEHCANNIIIILM